MSTIDHVRDAAPDSPMASETALASDMEDEYEMDLEWNEDLEQAVTAAESQALPTVREGSVNNVSFEVGAGEARREMADCRRRCADGDGG
jgi:nucleotide-binding universal stress UspA family protein